MDEYMDKRLEEHFNMTHADSPSEATKIVDKYWAIHPERFPNPYLLEKDIADALGRVRKS